MKAIARRNQANENYSIFKACARVGMDVASTGRATKEYCPFGQIWHSDGGDAPAMRVFEDSNHAYCFACQKYFTPSILISMAEDIPEDRAVESMLLELGYIESDTEARWAATLKEPEVDKSALAEALQMAAARIITPWNIRQYDEDVLDWLNKCLSLLEKVSTIEQGDTWLDVTKRATQQRFGKEAS